MRFWDTSALVPILADEPSSPRLKAVLATDPDTVVWWSTEVECISALNRLVRMGELDPLGLARARGRLEDLKTGWGEIVPNNAVRNLARRLLAVHSLRAADALQLAAAIAAAEGDPATMTMVTLDDRLADAARREGLLVVSA